MAAFGSRCQKPPVGGVTANRGRAALPSLSVSQGRPVRTTGMARP
eukprot:CAMPEP_0181382250 /NCGR_PEP_ID=MMETSP1106-20121128/20625_1 /TAXON_ID=81844 /ORGANISM="Mantoniella antarctica, Strain SL-175" /LENGTH=44 /DNA_ID= /DNA_START= /DNA_END= /DNA_ORIENTATION=